MFLRLQLCAIVPAVILFSCGNQPTPQTPVSNGELGQLTTQKADRLTEEMAHVSNLGESWHTEALNDGAKPTLNLLFKALQDGQAHHQSLLSPLLTSGFQCSPLLPSSLDPVFQGGGFKTFRGPISKEQGNGVDALSSSLTALAKSFQAGSSIHVDWKIFRVEALQAGAYETEVLVHLSGNNGDGVVQLNASWNVSWRWTDSAQAPKISRITLEEFDLVQGQQTQFKEQTAAIMGDSMALREQFSRGTDDWCARIDQAMGANQYAHNGLAVGDVNNDGLDDLYLCQDDGAAESAFSFKKPDGSVRDDGVQRTPAWIGCSSARWRRCFLTWNNDGRPGSWPWLLSVNRGAGRKRMVTESLRCAFQINFRHCPLTGGYSLTAGGRSTLTADLDFYAGQLQYLGRKD